MAYEGIPEDELAHALLAVLRSDFERRTRKQTRRADGPHRLAANLQAAAALIDVGSERPVVLAEAVSPAAPDEAIAAAVEHARRICSHVAAWDEARHPEVWVCIPLGREAWVAERFAPQPGIRFVTYR